MALRTKASVWTTAYGGIVRQNTWLARCQFKLCLQALIWHTRVLFAQHLDASRWTHIASLESLNLVRTFQIRFDSTFVKNGNFTRRRVSIGYRVWSYSCKSYNVYSCKSWKRCYGVFCRSSTIVSAANEKMIVKRGYSSRTDPEKCSSQKTRVTSSWHLRMVSWKWWWSSSRTVIFPVISMWMFHDSARNFQRFSASIWSVSDSIMLMAGHFLSLTIGCHLKRRNAARCPKVCWFKEFKGCDISSGLKLSFGGLCAGPRVETLWLMW